MIKPRELPTEEMGRVVYLTAQAASTVLRAYGVNDDRLYASASTELSVWGAHTRGNLLAIMRLLIGTIRESDRRRGFKTPRDAIRFYAARRCSEACIRYATMVPAGRVVGPMPLEIF